MRNRLLETTKILKLNRILNAEVAKTAEVNAEKINKNISAFSLSSQRTLRLNIINFIILLLMFFMLVNCQKPKVEATDILDDMKIFVSAEANRPVSFTNKEAAYYYTQSHENNHEEWAWFEGLNIAKKKIFHGYELYVGDKKLDNKQSRVWVYPYKMVRFHDENIIEQLWMFDNQNIIEIALQNVDEKCGILLRGDNVNFIELKNNMAFFKSMEGDKIIAVSSVSDAPISAKGRKIYTTNDGKGFLIAAGNDESDAANVIWQNRKSNESYKLERKARMRKLLTANTLLKSDNDSLQLALNWINITMDQLVTKQQGNGIYAGLPWFNEYWGRDEFIALPGACLVSGQFDVARKILLSFAEYQDTDENSKFFGRVPNIVQPENIDYHTTDGTPRFVIQLQEYVKYSGDTTIIKELYNNVKYSIEGSLKNWTDDKFYLIHADNETWMDARRQPDLAAYSPRGTRANDIQALWYHQLLAGVYFANYMNDSEMANKWQKIANTVKSNFAIDYVDNQHDFLADRLDENDYAEFKLRPNQLFTFDMIDDNELKWKATKICWEELVYPWGVASLNRQDEFFHPFHGAWEHYHKDEAYHNGTVWIWNNGIAMQRMIEAEQQETAWKLFSNMNRQVLTRGVVGGMCENMDAYPHKGKSWAKITGTYLQAWSNSEQLRTWYQYFLGIRPDMINNQLTLAPRIPTDIHMMEYNFYIGEGFVKAYYIKGEKFVYNFYDITTNVTIDIFPYEQKNVNVQSGDQLVIAITNDGLSIRVNGNEPIIVNKSDARLKEKEKMDMIIKDVKFCEPLDISNHKVMQQKYVRK